MKNEDIALEEDEHGSLMGSLIDGITGCIGGSLEPLSMLDIKGFHRVHKPLNPSNKSSPLNFMSTNLRPKKESKTNSNTPELL